MTVSIFNMADTWNAAGTTFNAILMNISNGAGGAPVFAAGSFAINIQNNGASVFAVAPTGIITIGTTVIDTITFANQCTFTFGGAGAAQVGFANGVVVNGLGSARGFGITNALASPPSTMLTSPVAATWQYGFADLAAPVAQTIQFQSVVAGTTNTAGQNAKFNASRGTGTGAGGQIIFQTAPAGSTGTTQNAYVPAMTFTAPVATMQPSAVLGNVALQTTDTDGFLYIASCSGAPTGVPTANTGRVPMVYDTLNDKFWFYNGSWKSPKTPAGAAIVTWQ